MKRGLRTLQRLRKAERDRALHAVAGATHAFANATARSDEAQQRASEGASALVEAERAGRPSRWWSSASSGAGRLVETARHELTMRGEAEQRLAEARSSAFAAERSLRVFEKLAARLAQREQSERRRALQRRLEDAAEAIRRALPAIFLMLAFCAAPALANEPDSGAGVVPLLAELRARNAELDRRELEVADRERHAKELERLAEARLVEARTLVGALEQRIAAWKAEQGDKSIARLARVYAEMPPRSAAPLLGRLDLSLATRIVAKMKPDQSAALLPFLTPERALAMSWLVAHPLALRSDTDVSAAEPNP